MSKKLKTVALITCLLLTNYLFVAYLVGLKGKDVYEEIAYYVAFVYLLVHIVLYVVYKSIVALVGRKYGYR